MGKLFLGEVRKKDRFDFIESMPMDYMVEILHDIDYEWQWNLALSLLGHGSDDNHEVSQALERAIDKAYDNADPDYEHWAFDEIDEEWERANAKRPDLV